MIISESIKNKIQELHLEGNRTDINLESMTSFPPLNKPRLDERGLITVRVYLGRGWLTLYGLKASDTIGEVKTMVCQEAINLGLYPLHPETRSIMSSQGGELVHLEDHHTLASLSDSDSAELPVLLLYCKDIVIETDKKTEEVIRWLSFCKPVRFSKEAHELNIYQEVYYMMDPFPIVNRPKIFHAPLPFAQLSDLGIHGECKFLDDSYRYIPDSDIMFAIFVQTKASVILLAPSNEILDHLVSLNRECNYLVVRVSWDKLSYFFVRKLRTSYPNIPIVAVTDLNPHHLDLITFLDTPPDIVPICYGWDLSSDFEELYSCDMDCVDIKWLGVRHTDCEDSFTWKNDVRPPPLLGFDEVICMLRVNPFLRKKKYWLEALDWLDVFGTPVSLLHPNPVDYRESGDCYLCFGEDFIANKLSEKDWV